MIKFTIKVSIVGASGYTGGELLRILANHPDAEVIGTYGKTSAGKNISELHPHLQGLVEFTVEDPDYPEIGEESDLVFAATPHGTAMEFVPELLDNGAKVIDISADYRLDDVEVFEEYYTEHASPEIDSVYGLPEIYRKQIKKADLVANPGCFPTSAILGLAPLLKENLIDLDHIIIDSKSGTSGAGAKPSEKLHHPTCTENLRAYNVISHRHSPEIKQEAEKLAGSDAKTYFTPHLIPMIRGILTTSHVFLKENSYSEKDLTEVFKDFYQGEPFVRVLDSPPQTNSVRGSNFCDIGVKKSEKSKRVATMSAIDNLVKGASGQAIQNMNLIFGLKEEKGLEQIPLRP